MKTRDRELGYDNKRNLFREKTDCREVNGMKKRGNGDGREGMRTKVRERERKEGRKEGGKIIWHRSEEALRGV